MTRRNIFDFLIILIIFSLDRVSKIIIIDLNKINKLTSYSLTPFLNLDLVWDQGIAFGLFSFNENIYYNV